MIERTLCIIKPNVVEIAQTGAMLHYILQHGYHIAAMRLTRMTEHDAEIFYQEHADREFFNDLVQFMSGGPCIVIALEKENAVADFRALLGATYSMQAADGTIRALWGEDWPTWRNAAHGSASEEEALVELKFFFEKTDYGVR